MVEDGNLGLIASAPDGTISNLAHCVSSELVRSWGKEASAVIYRSDGPKVNLSANKGSRYEERSDPNKLDICMRMMH